MQEWINTTVLIVTFVMLLLNSFLTVYGLVQKSKEPANKLDDRVDLLERYVNDKFKEYDLYFKRDLKRIQELENGNVIILESLQALLNHAVDGNNIDEMEDARKNISKYLLHRGVGGE